jgi:hypothetical protein
MYITILEYGRIISFNLKYDTEVELSLKFIEYDTFLEDQVAKRQS